MSLAEPIVRPPVSASGGSPRRPRRAWRAPDPLLLVPVAILAAVIAALLPLSAAVSGGWIVGAAVFGAVLLAVGSALRRIRPSGWLAVGGEALVWVFSVTALFLADTAVFVIVPTTASVDRATTLVSSAIDQLQAGFPPVPANAATTAVLIAAAGLVILVADALVRGFRMPVLAIAVLIAVAVTPAVPVSSTFTVLTFGALAAAVLWLLAVSASPIAPAPAASGTATARTGAPPRSNTATATVSLGGIAVVATIAIATLIPAPEPVTHTPGPSTVSIDGSLDLGSDLRMPSNVQVLTVTTSASTAPYLRVATLSSFTGTIWTPDSADAVTPIPPDPTGTGTRLDPVSVAPGIHTDKTTTRIAVDRLHTSSLPVPYPAVAVTGETSGWAFVPSNRTIIGMDRQTDPGVSYDVTAQVPAPTLQQIDAASATSGVPRDDGVPTATPPIVRRLADEVTAGQRTDYGRLEALQSWFRGPEFTYSLKSPVTHGFDSSAVAAVARFLTVKSGYCVHFASAFALMARELGMTSRIVIGFLPGTPTDQQLGERTVYSVTSSQLHAWPEVYFRGIGWVGFEPTKSLGSATAFAPAGSASAPGSDAAHAATAAPQQSSSPNTARNPRLAPDAVGGSAHPTSPSFAWWGYSLLVLALLASPGVVGYVRRRRDDSAIREGDPVAAWSSVLRLAVDLRIPLPPGESPRMFGDRLVQQCAAPPDAVDALVADIERASYAPERMRWAWSDAALPEHMASVRGAMRASVPVGRRVGAVLFPRSLVVRPGSATAASSAPSATR